MPPLLSEQERSEEQAKTENSSSSLGINGVSTEQSSIF